MVSAALASLPNGTPTTDVLSTRDGWDNQRDMPAERPVTSNEHLILERLLAFEFPGAEKLRTQLAGIEATTGSECGCATIDLAVDETGSLPAIEAPSLLPVTGTTQDGLGGVIVFQRNGWLSCMEIYNVGVDPIADFPPVETFEFKLDRRIVS